MGTAAEHDEGPGAPDARTPVAHLLKRDGFGCVERLDLAGGRAVVRRTVAPRGPLFGLVARVLLARERRALAVLEGLDGVGALLPDEPGEDRARVLRRAFVEGVPLSAATHLPRDFFEHLEDLVRALHERGVCHNDLHKEQNVLVRPDGRPALVDLQLASVHRRRGRGFRTRAAEDLRHCDKHRRRYERRGRRKTDADRAGRAPRSLVARLWRRFGKPLYRGLVRLVPSLSEPEPRRPSSGPWPEWTAPLGAAPAAREPIAPPRKFDSSS